MDKKRASAVMKQVLFSRDREPESGNAGRSPGGEAAAAGKARRSRPASGEGCAPNSAVGRGYGKCSQCRKDLCKEEKVCYTGTRRRQRCRNKVIDPKKGDHYGRKYQRDKSPSG